MTATQGEQKRTRRPSARWVRDTLLEIAYRMHATKVVKRLPAGGDRRQLLQRVPAPADRHIVL